MTEALEQQAERATAEKVDLIARRLRWLTAGVFLVALALLFNVAAVFGAIIEFHAGEGILIGSASAGGAVMGFAFGWLARRAG